MAKEEVNYDEATQKLLLQYLVSNETLYTQSQNILNPDYWNPSLRRAARFVIDYTSEYNSLPTTEQIKAETKLDLPRLENTDKQSKWFLSTIENFCRHKAMEALIIDGPGLLEKGDYAAIEQRSKENVMISLQKDIGTNYFDDPLARLEKMRDRTNMTSTGWRDIDGKLYGGMNRGELTFFVGGPGTGKSLFLQNLALNWMEMGKNVVYISLELSEELVGLRFDAMITGMGTRDIFKEMNNVATELGMIGKFGKDGHKWGKLNIKKMPEAGTTVNDIRAYLKEYELQTGIRPDAICVDYLDLLYPNSKKVDINSAFNKDKYTSEELRGLAAEWNILCATASQLNRNSVQEQNFDASHIAGGISKINTADNVLGIFTSQSMKENGEYQIQFLKTRSSSGVGSKVYLQFDKTSLRIIDSENGEEGTSQSSGMAGVAKLLEKRKVETTVVPTEKTQNKASTDVIARMRALGAAKSNE